MTQSTVITTKNGQVIRLAEPVALPESIKRVEIVKLGGARLIIPVNSSWDTFFDGPTMSDDFTADHSQSEIQERETR